MASKKEDRLFVKNGFRHYRRTYSVTETRIGIIVILGLGCIAIWVAWKGTQLDPDLFTAAPGQKNRGTVDESAGPATGGFAGAIEGGETRTAVDRGPVPNNLIIEGWVERKVSDFGPENLYEKINGREGYYKSFGFLHLWFVALEKDGDPATSVDIELYDQGSAENALGAYAGELGEGAKPEVSSGGLAHFTSNALFMTRGKLYLRAIGSDATPEIRAALEHLEKRFEEVEGEALPWVYGLFVGKMGFTPGRVKYYAENAFSFGFARGVYSVLLDDDDTEGFVSRQDSAEAAATLVKEYEKGFLQYGDSAEKNGGVSWVSDRYLNRVSGAKSVGPHIIGVKSAESVDAASELLGRIEKGLEGN